MTNRGSDWQRNSGCIRGHDLRVPRRCPFCLQRQKEESHERRTDTSNDLYRRSGEDQSQRRRNARVLSGTTNEDPGIATAGGRKASGNGHKERSISGDRKGCNKSQRHPPFALWSVNGNAVAVKGKTMAENTRGKQTGKPLFFFLLDFSVFSVLFAPGESRMKK